nr:putative ribonuclease H-like domain, reverse transcriptase zinc-binding domain-containing protein [Ipomoea batatas]
MVAVTVDGGGRSAHGGGALAGCGSRKVGIGGAAVDDGILAAIVSSPADCFYRLSEMASICSGGGMRWRASTVALPPPPSRLSLSLHVTDWRKTGGRGDGAPFSRYEVPNGQDSGDTLLYTAVHSQSEDIRAQYSNSDLQAGGAINSSAEAHGIPHQGQTGTPALGFLAQVQKMRKRSHEDYEPLVNGLQLDNLMNEAKCREVVINSWHSSSGRDILSRMEACSKEVWRWGKLFSTNFKRRISFWERLRSGYLSQFNLTDSPTCNKWTQLWNLPLPPKVKSLIWQACTDSIPTAVNLATRRVNCPQTCVLCEKELETTAHIFIYCDVARECWRNLSSISLDPNLEMAEWLGKNLVSMETVSICLLLTTCWKLWQIRNNKLWNNLSFQRNTIFAEAAAYLDAWNSVQRKVTEIVCRSWTEFDPGKKDPPPRICN